MNRLIKKNFWVNQKEADDLHAKAEGCCLSEAEFIRQLIAGYAPAPKPDRDFYRAMDIIDNMAKQIHAAAMKAAGPEDTMKLMTEAHQWYQLRNAMEKKYLRPREVSGDGGH